jgi:hypothetical protein
VADVAHRLRWRPNLDTIVHTIETTDPSEARRCRYAQFGGRTATLTVHGSDVTGLVRSVKEDRSTTPTRWTIIVLSK